MLAFLDWLSFEGAKAVIRDAFVRIWDFVRGMIVWLLKPVYATLSSAVSAAGGYMTTLAGSLGALTSYLSFANAWVPVDLFFQLAAAYSVLWLSVMTYRTVKSWIPTVSGGG